MHDESEEAGLLAYQRAAWNHQVKSSNRWTTPVDSASIAAARQGRLSLVLTPSKPIPRHWYPALKDLPVLCLAGAGGQQAPLLAAAGARVTVLDNSDLQLAQDRLVAEREGLQLQTIQGDMSDLSCFDDEQFGMVLHPCSNCFVPDILPVWRECARVLSIGGVLLAGFTNPLRFIFEDARYENGSLQVRYRVPTSDLKDLGEEDRRDLYLSKMEPLIFGHTLRDQIGGQLDAGLLIDGFYEDDYGPDSDDAVSQFIDSFIATRAIKLTAVKAASP